MIRASWVPGDSVGRARLAEEATAGIQRSCSYTVSELELFLDGSTVVGRMALTPPPLTQFSLASDLRR
jgi:hypothetical protein